MRYLSAVILVFFATQGTLWLNQLTSKAPFGLFYAAVAVTAWYGGLGPALCAAILSMLSMHYYVTAYTPPSPGYVENVTLLILFLGVAFLISYLTVSKQRAEKALLLQESSVLGMLGRMPDIFVAVDEDWQITYINRYFNGYQGIDLIEFNNQPLWKLYPQIIGTNFEKNCRQAMEDRRPMRFVDKLSIAGKCFDIHLYPDERGMSIFCIDITKP